MSVAEANQPRLRRWAATTSARTRAAAALTLILLPLVIAGFVFEDGALFFRPLWLDEWHTLLVAQRATLGGVLDVLSRGADFNPPLLFVWHWGLGQVLGAPDPGQLRATALVSIAASLVLLFFLLRRLFGAFAAFAGSLAVVMSGIIIKHAFEARFYGPWLLLCLTHLMVQVSVVGRPRSVLRQAAGCVTAILLCSIHYFGFITLALMHGGIAVSQWPLRRSVRALLPSTLAGVATVLSLTPLAQGQRAVLSVPTWIPDPTIPSAILFILPSSLAVLVAWVMMRPSPSAPALEWTDDRDRALLAGLLSLSLLPVLLLLFSLAVQSVLVPRYAMPALAVVGIAVAALVRRLAPTPRLVLVVSMFALVFLTGQREARTAARYRDRIQSDRERLRSITAEHPVVVSPSRLVIYPLIGSAEVSETDVALAMVDPGLMRRRFPTGSDSADVGDLTLLEQDVAAVHNRLFGLPRLLYADSLARLDCFFIIELTDDPFFGDRWFVDHETVRLRPHLFAVRRRQAVVRDLSQELVGSPGRDLEQARRACPTIPR